MFRKNKRDKEKEQRLSDLRIHFNLMDAGIRILLTDGRIGYFINYNGGAFTGETFSIEVDGVIQEVSLNLYDCVLVENPNLICPLCSSDRIMNGRLRNPDGTNSSFRENINSNNTMPTFNSRRMILHACRDCGYVMPFVQV